MKVSLWRDIKKYSKTKGSILLDERQMDILKELNLELSKSVILGAMVFIITYGFMEMKGEEGPLNFMNLGICFLGAITYYYTIRLCYSNVIGLDNYFEALLSPAIIFTPFLFFHSFIFFSIPLNLPKELYIYSPILLPIFFILTYVGINQVYRNGKQQLEKQIEEEVLHFRSRRMIVNNTIYVMCFINFLPISYKIYFTGLIIVAFFIIIYNLYCYGFKAPVNDYILNYEGLSYRKALWGKKGGFIAYRDIEDITQQDTFNIGYSKDKVCILCKNGKKIILYPENSYQFCVEIKNNI